MKKIIALILCFTSVIASTDTSNENLTDDVKVVDYFDSGQKECEINYKNGQKHGKALVWFENGKLHKEENWKDGKLHGVYKNWYLNGKIMLDANYKNGIQDGNQSFWLNDFLITEKYYKDGKCISGNCSDDLPMFTRDCPFQQLI